MASELIKKIKNLSSLMRDNNDKKCAALLDQVVDELKWASGEFTGIRLYTSDSKVAVACANAEERLNN